MSPERWTDQELRHLENPDEWDWERAELHEPDPSAGVVASVRFSGREYAQLAKAARQTGLSTLEYIREAALTRAGSSRPVK
jgi:hypothetical protein